MITNNLNLLVMKKNPLHYGMRFLPICVSLAITMFLVSCETTTDSHEEPDVMTLDTLFEISSVSHQSISLKRIEGIKAEECFIQVGKDGGSVTHVKWWDADESFIEISGLQENQNYQIEAGIVESNQQIYTDPQNVTTLETEELFALAGRYTGGFNLLMGTINLEIKFLDWNKIQIKQDLAENSDQFITFEAVIMEPDENGNREIKIPEQPISELGDIPMSGIADPVLGAFGDKRHGIFMKDGMLKYNIAIVKDGKRTLNSFLGKKEIIFTKQ